MNLVNELKYIDAALSVLSKVNGGSPLIHAHQATRIVSAASRRKMALAQRAHWAKMRKGSQTTGAAKTTGSAPVKRIMSASVRRKIAAAQRARWATLKAAKKAA
jgi:hypothetical protein